MTTYETTDRAGQAGRTAVTAAKTGEARPGRERRAAPLPDAVAPGRAAVELELKRDEFRLAVDLGLVRTVPGPGPSPGAADASPGDRAARRRVPREEIERLRGAPDFPDGLRERVRAVGTREGAALLSVTRERFARLARTGHFSPVRFYVNRYRAVVWLYPAAELTEFALNHPQLLAGRLPLDVRTRADDDRLDWRPRNWRARRLGMLLRASEDPWARAAAIASLLDPAHVAEVVDDPYERVQLDRFRPAPPVWFPNAPTAREIAGRLTTADDPDEILWHRMSLALALDEARADREAPRPGAWPDVPTAPTAPDPVTGPTTAEAGAADDLDTPIAAAAAPPEPVPVPPMTSVRAPALRPAPEPGQGPGARGRQVDRWPPRPVAVSRPPGRRARRSLLDRLRRRKEVATGPGT
ncbi:DUF6397 family protein [Streptomyces sp. NPDC053541]|uniref:DUF6397 family protein n=1 Tax=Streptomyces sp. NPDC053541 TaxID=3365709 RepID=UPI0037D0B7C3